MNAQQIAMMRQAQMGGMAQQQGMYQQQAYGAQAYPGQAYPAAGAVSPVSNGKVGTLTDAGTVIALELDGCFVSFDKLRRTFMITARGGSVMSVGQIPARPNLSAGGGTGVLPDGSVVAATPSEPMNHHGKGEKLGHKKMPITGAHSWQPRFFRLTGTSLTYAADENAKVIKALELRAGCSAKVLQQFDAARKDRFEDNDASMIALLTQPMGSHLLPTSGPIGKPNCVELICPAQIGNMLGGVLGATPLSVLSGSVTAGVKANQARTYYWSCATVEEANQWVVCLNNNIKLAKAPTSGGLQVGNGINMGQLDGVMHMAHSMQADQKNMIDPNESLGWYQRSLKTNLPLHELHKHLMTFYDSLRASGLC